MIFSGSYTNISSLDFSNNPKLVNVSASPAKLTSLDLSKNTKLMAAYVAYNPSLKSLNLANGNNASITNVDARFNQSLSCIQIDPGFTPPAYNSTTYNGWQKDATATYSFTDCSKLAVSDVAVDQQFSIYPNPTTNIINFSAKTNVKSVKIYDFTGKMVLNNSDIKGNFVNVQTLATGNYYLVAEIEGKVFKKSFIKK